MLTILRTSELIEGKWSQIEALDSDQPSGVTPDKQMKMQGRDGHIVPLSRQVVACLRDLREISGHGRQMFPGDKDGQHISNNTLLFMLHRWAIVRARRRAASAELPPLCFRGGGL
jgi:integrase